MGKRFWLLLLALSLFMPVMASAAITVTQTSPEDSYESNTASVQFVCSANDDSGKEITSLNLTLDTIGSMIVNYSKPGTGASSLSLDVTVAGIPNGNWHWNCRAGNNASEEASGADRAFTVAVPAPATTLNFTGPIPNVTFNEDGSNISIFDLDNYFQAGQSPTYSKSGNSNVNVNIATDGQVSFTAAANWSGTESIVFTATAGALINTSNTVVVTVSAVNDAPIASYIPSQNWSKGTSKTITLSDYFSDADGDVLIYNVSSMPANISITFASGVATMTPDANWTGTRNVVFTASDGSITTNSGTVILNVSSNGTASSTTNRAPVFDTCPGSGTGRFYLKEKEQKQFTVAVSDPDGNTMTIQWFIDNAVISGEAGTSYTFSKDTAATYTMKVTASDGNTSTSCTWIVIVEKADTNQSSPAPQVNVSSIIQQQTDEAARCGDGIIKEDEDCGNCPADVKCGENEECISAPDGKKVCMPRKVGKIKIILVLAIACALIGGGSLTAYLLTSKKKVQRQITEATPLKNIQKEVPAVEVHDVYAKIADMKKAEAKKAEMKIPEKPKESPLKKYAMEMRKKGFRDDEIAAKLKQKGWTDADIKNAL